MPLPSQLIDGYRAFLVGRLAPRAGPLSRACRKRPIARSHGDRLLRLPRLAGSHFRRRPGRALRRAQRRQPGAALSHRTAGPWRSAALEFGVGALKVKHIVVLGHAQCGGIKAFAEDAEPLSPGDFIGNWMKLMTPAAEKIGPRGSTIPWTSISCGSSRPTSSLSLDNLMTFPRLRTLIERGDRSDCTAPILASPTGQLSVRDPASGEIHAGSRRRIQAAFRSSASLSGTHVSPRARLLETQFRKHKALTPPAASPESACG